MTKYLLIAGLFVLSLVTNPVHAVQSAPADVSRFVELKRLGNGTFRRVALSPDGKTLALTTEIGVWLYSAETFTPRQLLGGHTGVVRTIAWSSDSQSLASGGDDGTVRIWNVTDGRQVTVLHADKDGVLAVAWSPDGHYLAAGGYDRQVRLWAIAGNFKLSFGPAHSDWILTLAWSPMGDVLASGDRSGTIRVWSLANRKVRNLTGHTSSILSLAWSPSGKILASGSYDKTVRLWDMATGQTQQVLGVQDILSQRGIVAVEWSPDGTRLATLLGGDGDLALLDMTGVQPATPTFAGGASLIIDGCWSVDGTHFYTIDVDGVLQDMETVHWQVVRSLKRRTVTTLNNVALSPDNRFVAVQEFYDLGNSSPTDRGIAFWDLQSDQLVSPMNLDDIWVSSAAWSPDGKRLLAGGAGIYSTSLSVRVVSFASMAQLLTLQVVENAVNSVAWSPDGMRLATGGIEQTVQIWDAHSGELLETFKGHHREITAVAWSPDGKWLASSDRDGVVEVWDTTSSQATWVLQADKLGVLGIAWSPDSSRLVTAGNSKTTIWDTKRQQSPHTLTGHSLAVLSVAWSPNGNYIATAGIDGTIRIWNADTAAQLAILTGHVGQVSGVAWSSDGKWLISVGTDNTVRVWGGS